MNGKEGLGDSELLTEVLGLADALGDFDTLTLGERDTLTLGDNDGLKLTETDFDRLTEVLGESELDNEALKLGDADTELDGVGDNE